MYENVNTPNETPMRLEKQKELNDKHYHLSHDVVT